MEIIIDAQFTPKKFRDQSFSTLKLCKLCSNAKNTIRHLFRSTHVIIILANFYERIRQLHPVINTFDSKNLCTLTSTNRFF